MNKKGDMTKILVAVVLVAAALLISINVIKKFGNAANEAAENTECKQSIEQHILSIKIMGDDITRASPIKCPIVYETLDSKKEEQLKFQLADRMKECWGMWKQGDVNLFTEEATYCHPCYIINFKHEDLEINDFEKYLIQTKVPGQKYSFMSYLESKNNNEEYAEEVKEGNSELEKKTSVFKTDTKKVILFHYSKDSKKIKEMLKPIANTATGFATGGIAGGVIGGALGLLCGPAAAACVPIGAKVGALTGVIVGTYIGSNILVEDYPLYLSSVYLRDYDAQTFKEMGCDIAPSERS